MSHQVYSYGILTPSTVVKIAGKYPQPDGYAEVLSAYDSTGGEACNTSIVLSRLDVSVVLDGLWLGDNQKSMNTYHLIRKQGIDASLITIKNGFENVEEIVITNQDTRTIFASYGKLFQGNTVWNSPNEEYIKNASIVCLDPFLMTDSKVAAELCVRYHTPYVTVDCMFDDYIAQHADYIIISSNFSDSKYPEYDRQTLCEVYDQHCKGTVILTSGSENIIYSDNGQIHRYQPPTIDIIDTTGAGDSFRAGIIYGYLQKYSVEKTIRFASLLAGFVCTTYPGVLNSPTKNQFRTFASSLSKDVSL